MKKTFLICSSASANPKQIFYDKETKENKKEHSIGFSTITSNTSNVDLIKKAI